MAVNLSIAVADIAATLTAGFTHIKVYRSAEQDSGFGEITTSSSLIELVSGVSDYEFIDYNGTTEHWYRTTFFDGSTESVFSASFQGTFVDTNFGSITYPAEAVFTSNDYFVIDKIRQLTGDRKELTRDYVSPATGYDSISEDGKTHTLSNPRGWPVSVLVDGVEFTSREEPTVNDFQFVTFSGSTTIAEVSGTVFDVWFYHFRTSDSEILRIYNGLTPPVPLTKEQVTFELAITCAAIEILTGELVLAGAISGLEVDIFEEIRINPKAGLDGRTGFLTDLLKRKQKMIDDILADAGGINDPTKIFGVLID